MALVCALCLTAGNTPPAAAAETSPSYDLRSSQRPGNCALVKLTFSVRGVLLGESASSPKKQEKDEVDSSQGGGAAEGPAHQAPQDGGDDAAKRQRVARERLKVPMSATSRLMYIERLWKPGERSVRLYQHCDADLSVGDQKLHRQLRAQHQTALCAAVAGPAILASVSGPLTREELDLLQVHGNSLLVHGLLPETGATRVGDRWDVSAETVCGLLNLDGVDGHQVTAQLVEVTQGLAILRINGTVDGYADGASAQITVQGELRYDMKWRNIRWLQLSVHETRESSPTATGFEVSAELRMLLEPATVPPQLDNQQMRELAARDIDAHATIELNSARLGFRCYHDRAWHVTRELPSSFVIHYIDRGDVLAECHLTQLPKLPAGKELSLEAFQADVQQALGPRFGQFVHAGQQTRDDGSRVLRVDVLGAVDSVAIRWIYYNVAAANGQRAALVFTTQEDRAETFAAAEQQLVAGFAFIPPATASTQKPADAAR